MVTDVLRFAGLTHGGMEILLTMFRRDCANLHQVRSAQSIVNKVSIPPCVSLTNHSTDLQLLYSKRTQCCSTSTNACTIVIGKTKPVDALKLCTCWYSAFSYFQ